MPVATEDGDHVWYGAPRHIWMWEMEAMIYMGLHAIFDDVLKVVASATVSGTCPLNFALLRLITHTGQTMFIVASLDYRS
eukprot:4927651-Pleurochrysis_carterae.AAC.1